MTDNTQRSYNIRGNDIYPTSSGFIARPAGFRFTSEKRNFSPPTQINANSVLLEIGQRFIGDPFKICADIDLAPIHDFFPLSFDEDNLLELASHDQSAEYAKLYTDEGKSALHTLISEIKRVRDSKHDVAPPPESYGNARYVAYDDFDTDKLKAAFLTIWRDNPFVDPRIAYIEQKFHCDYDNVFGRRMSGCAENMTASMAWAAQPDNAKAIARMFLYTRLTQHFKTEDTTGARVNRLANHVADCIDEGKEAEITAGFNSDPRLYFSQVVDGPPQRLFGLFHKPRILPAMSLEQALGLQQTLPTMVGDYKDLRDATWAHRQLGLQPQLSVEAKPQVSDLTLG